jgi:hypothetical protein
MTFAPPSNAITSALMVISASAANSRQPALILSKVSGSAGTRVKVVGRNCPEPRGQRDTLAWHDHYGWLHDREHKPPLGLWRRIPVERTSATTVRALFVVLRSDHLGRGLLDLFCNDPGNATATFTVTR